MADFQAFYITHISFLCEISSQKNFIVDVRLGSKYSSALKSTPFYTKLAIFSPEILNETSMKFF